MSRPNVAVGDGVKVYEPPDFGRMDAVVLTVNNATGVISARLVKSDIVVTNVVYRDDAGDEELLRYWTELPADYVPGSEGH